MPSAAAHSPRSSHHFAHGAQAAPLSALLQRPLFAPPPLTVLGSHTQPRHGAQAPLSDFLQLPLANLQRAFTLSMKAKPKKKHNASGAPMDGGTTGTWSDEVQT